MKTFDAVNISSKFAICGLPVRVDTYKTCSFGCSYCFSNFRKVMEFKKDLQIGDMDSLERRLHRVLVEKKYDKSNFLDVCIANGYTWHCGGMSDPFQPVEEELGITKRLVELSNRYGIHILFSTKSDSVYGANIDPKLHTFQLSITNTKNDKRIEGGVPSIERRLAFYNDLKSKGFKVGIRIQPFIPGITDLSILEMFSNPDQVTIEGLKLVPQNKEHKEFMMKLTGLCSDDFVQMGLLNLKPSIRLEMYKQFIEYMEKRDIPYSISDNDLRFIGNNHCCCGDRLVDKPSGISTTEMIMKYGREYGLEDVCRELDKEGLSDCVCNSLFTSNRQEGCRTVKEFYGKRFGRKTSPFSPKFQHKEETEQMRLFEI